MFQGDELSESAMFAASGKSGLDFLASQSAKTHEFVRLAKFWQQVIYE